MKKPGLTRYLLLFQQVATAFYLQLLNSRCKQVSQLLKQLQVSICSALDLPSYYLSQHNAHSRYYQNPGMMTLVDGTATHCHYRNCIRTITQLFTGIACCCNVIPIYMDWFTHRLHH